MDKDRLSTVQLREIFFMSLYKKVFPGVAFYIAKMGGSLDEAEDIFQDSLMIYYEKVTTVPSEVITNEKAYISGIAKKLWLQHYKVKSKLRPWNDADADIEMQRREETSADKVMHYLETAGKKCMELLKAFYYDHATLSTIVEQFGYSGLRSATVAKYKCLEKVRETVKQKSLDYADFIESN